LNLSRLFFGKSLRQNASPHAAAPLYGKKLKSGAAMEFVARKIAAEIMTKYAG